MSIRVNAPLMGRDVSPIIPSHLIGSLLKKIVLSSLIIWPTRSYMVQEQCPPPPQARGTSMNMPREANKSGQAMPQSRLAWVSWWATRAGALEAALHLLLLLGYIRRFLLWAFDVVGLGDLLDLEDDHQALLQDGAVRGCPVLVVRPLLPCRVTVTPLVLHCIVFC